MPPPPYPTLVRIPRIGFSTKALSNEQIRRIEQAVMAYAMLVYAILSVIGSVFKVPALAFLTDPSAVVPVIAMFLFFLARNAVRVADGLDALKTQQAALAFQADITSTHGSMWIRAESAKTSRAWATYLDPDAFKDGEVLASLKDYYKKAERFDCADYRRVFGIYPDRPQYHEMRLKSIQWLQGHLKRTAKLHGYQARYVEIEFQAAEMWIDDAGINFSFPSSRTMEAGWATTDPSSIELAKDYFQQLWQRSRPVEELVAQLQVTAKA